MGCIVYSNQRSTAEARRATTSTCTSLPLSIPCFYCVHLAYYSSPPAVIVVAVTGSCIFVFSRQKPPSLGASRTKSSIGIALQLSESGSLDYATLPCPALRRLLPHLPLYTTYTHHHLPRLLAACGFCNTPVTDARIALDLFLVFAILLSASGQRCRRARLISTRRFRRRAA
jgi:hypothetical protein